MVSPLDGCDLLLEESWELTALHQEAAALAAAGELWRDLEADGALPLPPVELDALLDWSVDSLRGDDLPRDHVQHDCMWAGKCDDYLHGELAPAEPTLQSAPPGRSLLRVQRQPPRPDTPLSLDEDDAPPVFRHHVDLAGTATRLLQPSRSPSPPPARADSCAVAADHSYTARPLHAPHLDALGVQTPSDSEEEIDVETVGDKAALPTNPSLSERASLQRTVASAMAPRKRRGPPPPAPGRKSARRSGGPGRRPRRRSDSDSEPDGTDVERRSLHNDMERMRRIGLKNLFDELKAQVPSTRDKARAPKVAILREAALLCRRLQAEEREREQLRRAQARLLARVRRLRRATAAAARLH